MTRLEFVKFESQDDFKSGIKALMNGEDLSREYTTTDGQKKTIKLVSKGRMYLGNNYSISLSQDKDGKHFLGVDYLSSEDRIEINKNKKDNDL